jgi:ubiquinone/menaquinone biosynthesis C-methylase UbiE
MTIANDGPPVGKVGLLLHNAMFYDLTVWLMTFGRERRLREEMLVRAKVHEGDAILDVGCGTGSLAIAAKRRVGSTGRVCAIDASAEMLARAESKARKAGETVEFKQAAVQALPFPDGHFDCVFATVMLHHLSRKARAECAAEVLRVLKPGGRFLAVEFGASSDRHGLLQHFHRHGHVPLGEIVLLLERAGFEIDQHGPADFPNLHFVLAVKERAQANAA